MAIVLTSGAPEPSITYVGLQALIAGYLHRTDLSTLIPGFISLAESFLFRELSIRETEVVVIGVTTGGVVALPSDCASVGRIDIFQAGREAALGYAGNPDRCSAGVSASYVLEAGALRLDSSAAGQAYALYYTPTLVALSDANPANWLLIHAFDLYLAAAQLEGARYTRDSDQMAAMSSAIPALLDSVQRFSKRAGLPLRSAMQIKPRGAR